MTRSMKKQPETMETLLQNTIFNLCKNGLSFEKRLKIQGLLAISVDSEVFVVQMDENFYYAADGRLLKNNGEPTDSSMMSFAVGDDTVPSEELTTNQKKFQNYITKENDAVVVLPSSSRSDWQTDLTHTHSTPNIPSLDFSNMNQTSVNGSEKEVEGKEEEDVVVKEAFVVRSLKNDNEDFEVDELCGSAKHANSPINNNPYDNTTKKIFSDVFYSQFSQNNNNNSIDKSDNFAIDTFTNINNSNIENNNPDLIHNNSNINNIENISNDNLQDNIENNYNINKGYGLSNTYSTDNMAFQTNNNNIDNSNNNDSDGSCPFIDVKLVNMKFEDEVDDSSDFPKHLQPPCLSNNNNNNNNNDNNSNINNNDNNNDCESSLLSHYNYKLGGCHGGSKSSSRSMRLSNGKKDIFTYNENGDRVKAFSCQYDGCTKAFFRKDHLTRHQRIKHGKPYGVATQNIYKCCNKTFYKHNSLLKHQHEYHNGEDFDSSVVLVVSDGGTNDSPMVEKWGNGGVVRLGDD